MASHFRCPECGQAFSEDGVCPGCLAELLPDAHHKQQSEIDRLLESDELTVEQYAIDRMMRRNRGALL